MARKKAPNKSQAIRDYYDANPSAKPKEVASELKKKGIKVSAAFVSTIRSTSKRKTGKIGKPGRPAGSSRKNGQVSVDMLLKAKDLVNEMGGIQQAKTAIAALEKLMN